MPPRTKSKLPRVAEPVHGGNFDIWNSVGSGHQRAETRGRGGWQASRNAKLQSQFQAGNTGGPRISDSVGVGSEDHNEQETVLNPKNMPAGAERSVIDMLQWGLVKAPASAVVGSSSAVLGRSRSSVFCAYDDGHHPENEASMPENAAFEVGSNSGPKRGIFTGMVVYLNGSTHPLISDHKLKHVLAENGANMSTHLGRRRVTHVILGRPSGGGAGAGGGLAGTKLEKEIRRVRGCGIKYVGVEWILESIKAGKRLPEARFSNLKVAAKGQASVLTSFQPKPGK